jgi:hypothetical protein
MAKIMIEMELDWLNEEQSIDDAIKQEVISSLKAKITADATKEITKELSTTIQETTGKVIDEFLGETLRGKIENMKIPYKGSTWDSKVEMMPMSKFIGMQYEQFLNKKVFDENGCEPRYSNDAKLSINEYFVKNYLEKELTGKVSKLIQNARKDAEETIIKTLEQTLKSQLSVDIIQRLNIPEMLKALQAKALMLDMPKE